MSEQYQLTEEQIEKVWETIDTFKERISELWERIKEAMKIFLEAIKPIILEYLATLAIHALGVRRAVLFSRIWIWFPSKLAIWLARHWPAWALPKFPTG